MIGSFLDLILSFRSSLRGRRSIGCIGSEVAFLCGMVFLATCLTGWINNFWLSFGSVNVFVVVVVVKIVDVAVRARGIGVTVFVSRIVLIFFQFVRAVFSTTDTDFCNALVFYSGGTLVCVCQRLRLQYCGSQYWFVVHQGLSNRSALIPFPMFNNLLICAIFQMGMIY